MITALNLLNKELPALSPQDDPVNALNIMDQFRVAHLPVVENGHFVGLISETSLLGAGNAVGNGSGEDDDLIENVYVEPQQHILDVLKVASENHLSLIPVVDKQVYMGSITLEELVTNLSNMQGAAQRGGIVVLEMEEKDYSLQHIARIVEENDAKILSTSVSPGDNGQIELNLKINKPDLNAILQSFERFSYEVKGSYQEPEYTEDLKKRYEELMKYLNI